MPGVGHVDQPRPALSGRPAAISPIRSSPSARMVVLGPPNRPRPVLNVTSRKSTLDRAATRGRITKVTLPDGRFVRRGVGAGAAGAGDSGLADGGEPVAPTRSAGPVGPHPAAGRRGGGPGAGDRVAAAERSYSDRRPFRAEPVPDAMVDALVLAARDDDVYAAPVQRADERLDLAVAFSWPTRWRPATRTIEPSSRSGPGTRATPRPTACRPRRCLRRSPAGPGTRTCWCATSRPGSPVARPFLRGSTSSRSTSWSSPPTTGR